MDKYGVSYDRTVNGMQLYGVREIGKPDSWLVRDESHAVADRACESYNGRPVDPCGEIEEWAVPPK